MDLIKTKQQYETNRYISIFIKDNLMQHIMLRDAVVVVHVNMTVMSWSNQEYGKYYLNSVSVSVCFCCSSVFCCSVFFYFYGCVALGFS